MFLPVNVDAFAMAGIVWGRRKAYAYWLPSQGRAMSNFASRALLKGAAFGRFRRFTAATLILWHIAEGALAAGVAERQVGLPLLRSRRDISHVRTADASSCVS